MPPVFLWHTFTDDCVPVENSLLLIAAMRKVNVPVEFHMYPGRRTRVIHLYGAVYECGWIWCTGAVSELASAGAHLAGRKSALQNRYKCVRIATD